MLLTIEQQASVAALKMGETIQLPHPVKLHARAEFVKAAADASGRILPRAKANQPDATLVLVCQDTGDTWFLDKVPSAIALRPLQAA